MTTIFLISLFCIGLRIVSSKGMILYFLRKPYDLMSDKHKTYVRLIKDQEASLVKAKDTLTKVMASEKHLSENTVLMAKDATLMISQTLWEYKEKFQGYIKWSGVLIYILKPVIGCCACMASIWTIVWSFYFELSLAEILLDAFCVAGINGFAWALYELLNKLLTQKPTVYEQGK